jgi:hypothetical protein
MGREAPGVGSRKSNEASGTDARRLGFPTLPQEPSAIDA